MQPASGQLFSSAPQARAAEVAERLVAGSNVRVERIVSRGQASPPGFWYDQDQHEFVALLSGAAKLWIEREPEPRPLLPGDWVVLPAHCRHRVEWTDPAALTVWLAVFYDAMPE
jgi:cupin 2 domain-containing protein